MGCFLLLSMPTITIFHTEQYCTVYIGESLAVMADVQAVMVEGQVVNVEGQAVMADVQAVMVEG